MTTDRLPPTARILRTTLRDLVQAAVSQDVEALAEARARLDRVDPEHVRLVLGHVVRELVERAHPDGVDADDLSTLIEVVLRGSAWCPHVAPSALVAVLAGAFGVHPDDETPAPPAAAEVVTAAAVLAAHLLRGRGVVPLLDAALAEVARAETVEMP